MNTLSGWDDTIIALATPPGVGAIGVIRLSGPASYQIVNNLFPAKDLLKQAPNTIHVGLLKEDGKVLDEVVLSLFKSPHSYTGEDVIEISCHGSPFVQQQVLDACIRQGCRLAKPGEFTQRAFLNGKLDLAQAESVADLIASNTEASRNTALHTMRGGFSTKLKELREQLIKFGALIELELDFSQEDVEFADRKQFADLLDEMTTVTKSLTDSFKLGNVIRHGVSVAIVGRPNAGKSTLLNTLLNENRAIVSEIPGTTRDTIEELINIDGILFRLIDTAGIREHTSDQIELAGIARSLDKMQEAGLVILLVDADEDLQSVLTRKKEMEEAGLQFLIVVNKIDREGEEAAHTRFGTLDHVLFISAKQHQHIETLKKRMVDTVISGSLNAENTIVTNARHYHALVEVSASLQAIQKGLNDKLPGDLLAPDIRRALHFLGEITGEVSSEDMLDYVFSKFCIGK